MRGCRKLDFIFFYHFTSSRGSNIFLFEFLYNCLNYNIFFYLLCLFSNNFRCRCRAPIASLDCMEEFNGVESGVHCNASTGTKEQLLTGCISSQSQRLQQPSPGIRYRNLGKSGLRVSNVGLGTLSVSPLSPNFHFCIKFSNLE